MVPGPRVRESRSPLDSRPACRKRRAGLFRFCRHPPALSSPRRRGSPCTVSIADTVPLAEVSLITDTFPPAIVIPALRSLSLSKGRDRLARSPLQIRFPSQKCHSLQIRSRPRLSSRPPCRDLLARSPLQIRFPSQKCHSLQIRSRPRLSSRPPCRDRLTRYPIADTVPLAEPLLITDTVPIADTISLAFLTPKTYNLYFTSLFVYYYA